MYLQMTLKRLNVIILPTVFLSPKNLAGYTPNSMWSIAPMTTPFFDVPALTLKQPTHYNIPLTRNFPASTTRFNTFTFFDDIIYPSQLAIESLPTPDVQEHRCKGEIR